MLTSGKSYKEIAVALNRYDEKSTDPTKPLRAIISRMKTVGYTNQKGEFGKLKIGKQKAGRPKGEMVNMPKAAKLKAKAGPPENMKAEPEAK